MGDNLGGAAGTINNPRPVYETKQCLVNRKKGSKRKGMIIQNLDKKIFLKHLHLRKPWFYKE